MSVPTPTLPDQPEILVANAPVNYGVLDFTLDSEFLLPGAEVLRRTASAGYRAIDLGPLGYLGAPDSLAVDLAADGLELSGAWVALTFPEPEQLAIEIRHLTTIIDLIDQFEGQRFKPENHPRRHRVARARS